MPQLDEFARLTLEVFLDQNEAQQGLLQRKLEVATLEKKAVIAKKNLAVTVLKLDLQWKNIHLMRLGHYLHCRGILRFVEDYHDYHGPAWYTRRKRVDIWTGLLTKHPDLAQCISAANDLSTSSPEGLAGHIEKMYDNLNNHEHSTYTAKEWDFKGTVILSDRLVSLLYCRMLACICQHYNIPYVLDLKEDCQDSNEAAPEEAPGTNDQSCGTVLAQIEKI